MKTLLMKVLFANVIKVSRSSAQTPKKGVVLLLGWAGAKQRHLTKLALDYNKMGMSTVSFIMPQMLPQFLRDWLEQDATKNVRNLLEEDKTKKFVVHSYSNNGVWTYSSMTERKLIPIPSALILDAAPYLWYEPRPPSVGASTLAKVFTAVLLQKDIYNHPIITPLLHGLLTFGAYMSIFISKVQGPCRIIMDIEANNRYMRDSTPIVPTLFIYSLGDKLVPPEAVRDFINSISKRGYKSEEKVFGEGVSHVASYFSDPVLYMANVQQFLDKISVGKN